MQANFIKKRSKATGLVSAALLLVLCLTGCSGCKKNKHKVDLSDVQVSVTIHRFEHELEKITPHNYDSAIDALTARYSKFSTYYAEDIIYRVTGGRSLNDSMARFGLMQFVTDPDIRMLFNRSDSIYNGDYLEKQLGQVFRYYRYHFPTKVVPEVYTFISPFDAGVCAWSGDDSLLAIGLDLFLGHDFAPYYTTDLPSFIIRRFEKQYIAPLVANKLAERNNVFNNEDKRLLNRMINEGKKLYFVDAMVPEAHDTLKIGYTRQQLEWCKTYEDLIWKHLIEKKMLYSTDQKENNRYTEEAPFTAAPDVPGDSAPRIAIWTGWQIVRLYMEKHPDVTLAQLMALSDPDKILRESGYKPL